MKKLLYLLILCFAAQAAQSQTPTVTMVTSNPVGSTFSFNIQAKAPLTIVRVDWGGSFLSAYLVGTSIKNISGTLRSNTIRILGEGITYLDLSSRKLSSLDVSAFTQLTSLSCQGNQLKTLNVSKNTALVELDCSQNAIGNLDLTQNSALQSLMCFSNKLGVLDLSRNTKLTNLNSSQNNLTSLNLSNNTRLTEFNCSKNRLTTLDVSRNTTIYRINCSTNQLTALDVSKNLVLKFLYCQSNQLKFSTLPVKKTTWSAYYYSPQNDLPLPQNSIDLTETIDLSSQLSINGITTAYAWKTKGGVTLAPNIDYTATNGTFSFLKPQTDSVYCQMTNVGFPLLALSTKKIWVRDFTVSMVTSSTIGSTFSFDISASSDNSPIAVDWGNGTITRHNLGTSISNVSGTLAGSTVKVHGKGISYLELISKSLTKLDASKAADLSYLRCDLNQLTKLDVTKNSALTFLCCNDNLLTSLDVSKNGNLRTLWCGSNQLTSINASKNTVLNQFDCHDNWLTSLDVTQNTVLTRLYCYMNHLSNLDISKNTVLTLLNCSNNRLITLDISKNTSLSNLNCGYNKLTFTTLPVRSTNLITYNYSPQESIRLSKNTYELAEPVDLNSQLNVIGSTMSYEWRAKKGTILLPNVDYTATNGVFASLKPQPDSIYCNMTNSGFPGLTLATKPICIKDYSEYSIVMTTARPVGSYFSMFIQVNVDVLPIQVDWGNGARSTYTINADNLSVSGSLTGSTIKVYGAGINLLAIVNQGIMTLDISRVAGITSLICNDNLLETIDISNNAELRRLECSGNKLKTINLSKNPKLTTLRCGNSDFENLDLLNNTALEVLHFYSQKLKTVDLSKNSLLVFLDCSGCSFNTLDLSMNTSLNYLHCNGNQLTNLDLSHNALLTYIDCSENLLTSINVANSKSLGYINCYSNKLTALNLTNNTILYELDCSYNQLSTLDIPNSSILRFLKCNNNQLTTLNISKNIALEAVECEYNNLTALDVSKNTILVGFDCAHNQIATLDVSNNPKLKALECPYNQLTFTTLPIKQAGWEYYIYNPQQDITLSTKSNFISESMDLSSHLVVNGNTTDYVWETNSGAILTPNIDYTESGGVFTFLKPQTENVYCQMTNTTFPSLTLKTTSVAIVATPALLGESRVNSNLGAEINKNPSSRTEIEMYPNPVKDALYIDCTESITKVEVYTIAGAKILEQNGNYANTLAIPAAYLLKGVLVVRVFSGNGVMERKVIKE